MTDKQFLYGWWMDGTDLRPHLRDNNLAGLFQHLDKLNSACHLVMDDMGLAKRIKDRFPESISVFRRFSGHQGGEWKQYPNAKDFARYLASAGEKNVLKYLTNEPQFNAGTFKEWANHEADTLIELNRLGHAALAFNTGVGRYQPEWIARGDVDNLINAVMANPRNRFAPHEYQTLCLAAGWIDPSQWYDPDTDTIPNVMQYENWPRPNIEPSYNQFHLLFRHVNIVKRCLELGYSKEQLKGRFIIGEFGYDETPDPNNEVLMAAINTLRIKFGIKRYHYDMRGVNTYEQYRDKAWPDRSSSEQIVLEFRYILELIAESDCSWIGGILPYGLNADWEYPSEGYDKGNHAESGHDYSIEWRWFPFAPLLENLAAEYNSSNPLPAPEPIPEPTDIPMRPPEDEGWTLGEFTFEGLRFREQPSLLGDYIVTLNGVYQGMLNKSPSIMANGYSWVAVYIESLDKYGWVAEWSLTDLNAQFFTFEDAPITLPDPEPIPTPDSEKRYFVDFGAFTVTLTQTDRLFRLDEANNKLEYAQRVIQALENATPIEDS